MSRDANDLEFDAFLRAAMSARPQPDLVGDLAARAMALAAGTLETGDARLGRIVRLRRRNRLVGVAAAVLIGVVVLLGSLRLSANDLAPFTSATAKSASTASADATGTGSADQLFGPNVLLAGEILLAALVLLSVAGPLMGQPGSDSGDLAFH